MPSKVTPEEPFKKVNALLELAVKVLISVIAPVATPESKAPASNNVVPFDISPILTILYSVKFYYSRIYVASTLF